MKKFLLLLTILLAFIYRNSFFARFFQDDFLLLKLAKAGDIFTPIANFPYRPLSIQIFYGLGFKLFGENPFGYHLLLFLIFIGALFFVYKLSNWQTTIIYAFNISLFPLFYWVAASYFVLAAFFTFGAIYFYQKSKILLALLFFVLGLLSNEIVVVLPILLLLTKISRRVLIFFFVDALYLLFRVSLSLPQAKDYTLDFSLKFLTTFRWYFLRIFNLPEGRLAMSPLILILFICLILILLANYKNFSFKKFILATVWFFVGALPFFFLPFHMSAYYLTISLFGPAVFLCDLLSKNRKLTYIFLFLYLLLTVVGLDGLSKTHWIILKP